MQQILILLLFLVSIVFAQETDKNLQKIESWKDIWNGEYADFTSKSWSLLPTFTQIQIAKEYQQWYATEKGVSVEKIFTFKETPIEIILIPPGIYWQGSSINEEGRDHKREKRRKVLISKPFWCGKFEITRKQWIEITQKNDFLLSANLRKPANAINWKDAQDFCEKLGGNLLTEAQWEYACRGGTTSAYYWGEQWDRNKLNSASYWAKMDIIDEEIWGNDFHKKMKSFGADLTEVGTFEPNSFGLYDMYGNVAEWCLDVYKEKYGQNAENPSDKPTKKHIERGYPPVVSRGSSIHSRVNACRSAYRAYCGPNSQISTIGFRICFSFVRITDSRDDTDSTDKKGDEDEDEEQ